MKAVLGKVGHIDLKWLSIPRGPQGSAYVQWGRGQPIEVHWKKDVDGIWIEFPNQVVGFDIEGENSEEGVIRYRVKRRGGNESFFGLSFLRSGEEVLAASSQKAKKGMRVRAQMPGKIIKICLQVGASVEKGDPLIVMEAMKMENQICASQKGMIKRIAVSEGTTVETGTELMEIDFLV
jgi:acetyl/propionyl-CoA carboxylase alpha subunit